MSDRGVRVSGEVKRVLSDLVRTLKDPRKPEMLSITAVKVTGDLSLANVYFSVYGNDKDKENAKTVLESAAGYLRHELGKEMRLRKVPELRMIADDSIERGFAMDALIDRVIAEDEKNRADREQKLAADMENMNPD
ncbi:MAG TPA: 30S ribosome-binding factor RbfA [Clostridiaceae bacterium]|nr:30S ribosome-binding factor RbfA [Clostridiaceae bacterium]